MANSPVIHFITDVDNRHKELSTRIQGSKPSCKGNQVVFAY